MILFIPCSIVWTFYGFACMRGIYVPTYKLKNARTVNFCMDMHARRRPHFEDYAETCFKLFGDRVKLWVTLNEPKQFSVGGYAINQLAPWRCSPPEDNCTGGNSGTEPYFVGHYLLLAHAKVVKIYRDRYQVSIRMYIDTYVHIHIFAHNM